MHPIAEKATQIRRTIVEMANRTKSPHVGSCLSCADILATLYFNELRLDPWEERDICILSKGHAAMALYSTLAARGILTDKDILGYYQNGGTLPAHLDRCKGKGVEVSSGSLGHGFNMGLGIAYGFKKQQSGRRVFAVVGDGESQEGSIWEGALFAPKLGLDNFTVIIDRNNLQGYGRPTEICSCEPMREKWEAFGWNACEVNGHDHDALKFALARESHGRPKVIIANTFKGKGVSFMEDQLVWHYFIVTDEHLKTAMEELA
ncbi:transketolase [Citrifermentans bremense]|uniref:transketolase n=1 Tax=Citrifermentans bremense TaxID=60035 RepID=UPI00040D3108|nr:transketolase [Citrifermentans bremense]